MNIMNQVRGYHFLLGVLRSQQADLYCGQCSAWNNTLNNAREALVKFETEQADSLAAASSPFRRMLADAREGLAGLRGPVAPAGQKKAGNCKLPEGVCFIKASFAILQKI
ncbi:MAG: hypothetical protein OEW15_13530 [Nitrospirota bacterium]|nr:hypothetical protein [Nitrospirota bacterium]